MSTVMTATAPVNRERRAIDMLFFASPGLWPYHPFLSVRRQPNQHQPERGILYDAQSISDKFGYRCTVFIVDTAALPNTESELLQGPRYVYDTFEEMVDDGWTVA